MQEITSQNKSIILQSLDDWRSQFNQVLQSYLETLNPFPTVLSAALYYTLLNNAKRLRPLLVYATGSAFSATPEAMHPAAIAIELIHTYSLIHDDLPAMDDDDLRRGKASCHKAFDEATAILAGDVMQSSAFALLSKSNQSLTPLQQIKMTAILAHGSTQMVCGQMLDIAAEGQDVTLQALEEIHQNKTGHLITASILLGATAANVDSTIEKKLTAFGQRIGLCFQIQDDILNVVGDVTELGKPQGSDNENHKATYPKLLGLEAAKLLVQEKLAEATQLLDEMPVDFSLLKALAKKMVVRSS